MTLLEEYFHNINSRYFRSRLKNVRISWKLGGFPKETELGRTSSAYGFVPKGERKFWVQISDQIRKHNTLVLLTLFHELVHVQLWDETTPRTVHGRKFNNRMKQLAARGAFNGLW